MGLVKELWVFFNKSTISRKLCFLRRNNFTLQYIHHSRWIKSVFDLSTVEKSSRSDWLNHNSGSLITIAPKLLASVILCELYNTCEEQTREGQVGNRAGPELVS